MERSLASTGLVGVILLLATSFFLVERPANETAGVESIRAHYVQNGTTTGVGLGLGLVAQGLLLAFSAYLYLLLRRFDALGAMPLVALAGGFATAILWIASLALDAAPFLLDMRTASDESVMAAFALTLAGESLGDATTVPRAVWVVAVSLASVRTRALPKWLAWLGIPVAVLCAAGAFYPIPGGLWGLVWFAGLAMFLLWWLLVAWVVAIRSFRPSEMASASPTPR